jgi:hypothetical protein
MWNLEELKQHRDVLDNLNWEMTPEKAVETYLEWGTGWSRKGDFVRYSEQVSYYFVIYDWEQPLQVTLVRRDVNGMEEIARLDAPQDLIRDSIVEGGRKPGVGVYALSEALQNWLKQTLNC